MAKWVAGTGGREGGTDPRPGLASSDGGRARAGEGFALLRSLDTQNKPIFRIQTPWGVAGVAAESRNPSSELCLVNFVLFRLILNLG